MRRRVAIAALAVLALAGCGDADTVATTTSASQPEPSTTSTAPTEAAPTPEATPERPRSTEPPPSIGLPTPISAGSQTLPVDGVAVRSDGVYDLYVQCLGEIAIWPGARAGDQPQHGSAVDGLGCDAEAAGGGVFVAVGMTAEQAQLLAIVEPDSTLPMVVRVPSGTPLDAAQRSRFADALTGVRTFEVAVSCVRSGPSVRIGDEQAYCVPGPYSQHLQVDASSGVPPALGWDDAFVGRISLWPQR